MKFSIWKYVKLAKGWRYCPAVLDRGVPVKDMVMVGDGVEVHTEGCYYLNYKRKWIKAGPLPQDALDASLKLGQPEVILPEKPKLWQQAMQFLEHYNVGKSTKTQYAMKSVLKNFLESCTAPTVEEVTKDHVRDYWQWEVDHSPTKSLRTAHNRVTMLGAFLKDHGVDVIGKEKGKWKIPPFDEEVPEIYEDDELALLLGASDDRHRAAYSVMLKALLREKEVVYLTWADVDAKRSVLKVRSKPVYGWRVKKFHERDVTVPRTLIAQIMNLPKTGVLVFGIDGKPDHHLLRYLKDVAKRTEFVPERAWLHKFRATGCTKLLQAGVPLPDVMAMGGWRDLASVQRYMGLLNHDRRQKAVEAAWATGA
jgi:site-specific recombinase XerD